MSILGQLVQVFKANRSAVREHYACYDRYDWREPLLIEAARKHGKPFKCAGNELPREIILAGKELVVVGVEDHPIQVAAEPVLPQRKNAQPILARRADSSILGLHRQRQQVELTRSLEEQQV